MYNCNLIVLSYHRFTEEENEYPFSRTYKQFRNDIETRDWDFLCIDDCHKSIIKACKMLQDVNHRAKIFVSSALVGTERYLTWDELWTLSRYHDLCNHSHEHRILTELSENEIYWNIHECTQLIKQYIGIYPRWFCPPFNQYDDKIEEIANELGMQLVKDRITIKNDS